MKASEKNEILWRSFTVKERLLLSRGIRHNNLKCTIKYIKYSVLPFVILAFIFFFVGFSALEIFSVLYAASIPVFFSALEKKNLQVLFGNIKCADAACFSRDEQYQYTVNGFSYYVNVFRLSGGTDKRVFKLPAYKNTLLYANIGDNMLAVRFSKNNIRCFSKKELGLTTHSPKSGSWSKLSKKEIMYVLKSEKQRLKEARIIFGIDFIVSAIASIIILINFISVFAYAVIVILFLVIIDSVRIRKYNNRIKKIRRADINALKNAVVSCFLIKKPKLTGGFRFIYYLKIMHPETGRFRIEKLREFSWASVFDNEISDNIIVVDFGKKHRGREMQHYIIEEY